MGCAERGEREPNTALDAMSGASQSGRPLARECGGASTTRVTGAAVDVPLDLIEEPARPPGARLDQTVSLGYAGDGKLTQIEPHERLWYGDGYPRAGYVGYPSRGYGYGYSGSRGYGRGAVATAQGSDGSHSSIINGPQARTPGMGGSGASGSSGGRPSGSSRGPR